MNFFDRLPVVVIGRLKKYLGQTSIITLCSISPWFETCSESTLSEYNNLGNLSISVTDLVINGEFRLDLLEYLLGYYLSIREIKFEGLGNTVYLFNISGMLRNSYPMVTHLSLSQIKLDNKLLEEIKQFPNLISLIIENDPSSYKFTENSFVSFIKFFYKLKFLYIDNIGTFIKFDEHMLADIRTAYIENLDVSDMHAYVIHFFLHQLKSKDE
jgi:hypothetical protein